MQFFSLCKFLATLAFRVFAAGDTLLDRFIDKHLLLIFTACKDEKIDRHSANKRDGSCLDYSAHLHCSAPLYVVILAALKIPATSEQVPSHMPAATSFVSIRSDMRGIGKRISW